MSLAEPGKPYDSLGEWWYVDAPENRVRGRVSYVPAGTISLSLYCGREKLGSMHPELLHGQCGGREVTLMDVHYDAHSWAKGGIEETQFEAERLLIGEHFQRKDFTFSELSARFDQLENWIGHSPFDWKAIKHDHRHVAASFVAPEPTEVEVLPNGMRILFDPELSPGISGQHFIVKYQCRVRILPNEPKSIFWFETKLGTLASLLSLLADSAMHPVELLGQTGSQEDKAPFIIFAPGWDPRAGPTGAWKHIIFYHLIEGSFAPIVQNWFAFADAYRPVWTALVDGIYYPGQFLESQLLGTVQALEGLHRRDFEGVYISSEDFEEVRKAVVGAIPQGTDPALRQALKEKLTWGNEFSLRKRLRQLLASIPQSLADAVGRKKIQQLPDELTETRNALAHCVDPPKQAPDMWLFHLTMQSRLLLKLLVLRKIGVPDDVIAKAITF